MNVVVVGGSLGGLFAAVAVKKTDQGHKVRILERNSERLHDQGAGLVMGGDTAKFFERFDESNASLAVESPYRHYLDQSGQETSREEWLQRMSSWDLLYNALRYNFDGDCDDGYVFGRGFNGDKADTATNSELANYSLGCTVQAIQEIQNSSGKKSMELIFEDSMGATRKLSADLIIGADGASSTIRSLVDPSSTREYVGYVVWRGTCPENLVSASTYETLVEKFTFFHGPATQTLAYVIPGDKGAVEKGKRLINWAWYCNYPAQSSEYKQLMTDTDGNTHRITLPLGKMNPEIWRGQKERAVRTLPPQFAEVVCQTTQPFVQAVTDVISEKSAYYNGKVLLVGDALAGFRPHTAASTSQAAFDSLLLHDMLKGKISLADWEYETMQYATEIQQKGVMMGNRSQFSDNPVACAPGGR